MKILTNRNLKSALIAVLLAFFTAFCSCGSSDNGNTPENPTEEYPETVYSVVVCNNDEGVGAHAAIFADYLKKMTGRTYSVLAESALPQKIADDSNLFYLGKSLQTNEIVGDGKEKYSVKSDGKNVYINGNSSRAIIYGIYSFLRYAGCEYYSADCESVPKVNDLKLDELDITETPDISIRHYLSWDTCYDHADGEFTTKSLMNSAYGFLGKENGGTVTLGYLGADTHNARYYVGEEYWGSEYCPANPEAVGGYVPCLTNGIEYNTDKRSTLSLVTANMKKLVAANTETEYFTFEQEDGHDGAYCTCSNCVAAADKYGRSGVLVRFCNALIEKLRSDAELNGRNFKIVTFAYEYTKEPPKGGVTVDKDLCIWYADYSDMRYSLTDERQIESYKNNLSGWLDITKGKNDGSLMIWLYDTSYNNYLSYFGTSMSAIDKTVDEITESGAEMLLVLGAYDADNIWQSKMRSFIWSKKSVDKTLRAADLRDEFIDNYFGVAAGEYIKKYCDAYDRYYADNPNYYPVRHGNEYLHDISATEHVESLGFVNDAIAAINTDKTLKNTVKNRYLKRLYGVKSSSYCSILYYFDSYFTVATDEQKITLFGSADITKAAAKENFTAEFRTLCKNAGITRCREGTDSNNTVDDFIANNVGKKF